MAQRSSHPALSCADGYATAWTDFLLLAGVVDILEKLLPGKILGAPDNGGEARIVQLDPVILAALALE